MSAGTVYVLTNEAMPGLVKIGFTRGDLVRRIKELDRTGVPYAFECFCAFEVSDCARAEQLLHDVFGDHRIRSNREFFRVAPERVLSALMLTGGRDVTPSETDVIPDAEELEEIRETKKRADNNTFTAIRIAPGSTLTFSKDPSITCKVHGDKKVDLDGEILSVSKAAHRVLTRLGYNWSTVNGWAYWCYRGKTLSEYFLADENQAA